MIVKNEARRIEPLLLGAVSVVEEIHVTDTGSTDRTVTILERLRRRHPAIHIHHHAPDRSRPFHFARARNASFRPAKQEWILWLDADDVVDWKRVARFKRRVLDAADVDAWALRTICARDAAGRTTISVDRERFVRRSVRPRWQGAVHEIIDLRARRTRFYPGLVVEHLDLRASSLERNLRILTFEHQRRPTDLRVLYYLGILLYERGDARAIDLLERYVSRPRVPAEEFACRFRLALFHLANGRPREASEMAIAMYALDPTRRRPEPFYVLGLVDQQAGQPRAAVRWFSRCLEPPPRLRPVFTGLFEMGDYYGWRPLRRVAECYAAMGDRAAALRFARKAREGLALDGEVRKWERKLARLGGRL
jgi:tetratricopeptide (TPR) repeat protein